MNFPTPLIVMGVSMFMLVLLVAWSFNKYHQKKAHQIIFWFSIGTFSVIALIVGFFAR